MAEFPPDVERNVGSNSNPTRCEQPSTCVARPIVTQDVNINVIYASSYLEWSIFNILCCFLILGIVACFFPIATCNARGIGDLQGALKNSRRALITNLISTIIGIIVLIIIIINVAGNSARH